MAPSPPVVSAALLPRVSAALLPRTVHGDKGSHAGGAKQGRPNNYLSTHTTNFSVLLRDAYVGDNGAFVLALFLSAFFAGLATLLAQSARRAEASVLARRPRPPLKVRAAAAFVHGVRLFLLYLAVMVAMSRNLWLLLAMVVGHMVGWFVFATVAAPRPGDAEPGVVDGVFDDDDDMEDAGKRKPSEVS